MQSSIETTPSQVPTEKSYTDPRLANLERFNIPSSKTEYDIAVKLIRSKLPDMKLVNSIFRLNLAPNHPELIIDARHSPAIILETVPEQVEAEVFIRAVMVKRFYDGLMEARYAMSNGHVYQISGPPRVGVKLVDAIGPFGAVHPRLDRLNLDDLPKPTEDTSQVKADLEKWGYGFIKNALSPTETACLRKRLMDQAKGEADAGVGYFDGGESKPNQRVWCLPNKGQEFIDLLETNAAIDDMVPDFLGDDAILFSYTANIARPGNTPMHMHTDQITIQPPVRSVAFGMNLMYFLEDVTEENGGTRVMPGSHKGNWAPDDPHSIVDTVAAAGPAGTCMVFESRLWHATGANKQGGSERPVILVFFVRACMRQQENFVLSVKEEVTEKCSDKVKGYLGWRTTGSVGGVQGFAKDGTIVKKPSPSETIGVMGGRSQNLARL